MTAFQTDSSPSSTLTTETSLLSRVARVASALMLAGAMGAPAAPAQADDDAEIVAAVSGLRSTEGVVRIALYSREGDWLSHEHTISSCTAHVHGESASCSLGNQAPGTYAIALLHDEDADDDMDRDWIGIPQEGYGFSSGARPGFGPPSFGDASFCHGAERTVASIRARYGI